MGSKQRGKSLANLLSPLFTPILSGAPGRPYVSGPAGGLMIAMIKRPNMKCSVAFLPWCIGIAVLGNLIALFLNVLFAKKKKTRRINSNLL